MFRLTSSLLLFAAFAAAAPGDDTDERVLREAGVGTDGPSLVKYFRTRAQAGVDGKKIAALIKQLGSGVFEERERASAELVGIGGQAEPHLREVLKRPPELEVRQRAEWCLQQIARGGSSVVPSAAARVIAQRKPEGAAAALLAYLPNADGEAAAQAVRDALPAVAVRDGKPDPVVVAALDDRFAVKRSAAAVALARGAARDVIPALRKLLRDPDAVVRLRVALALIDARDKEAVPTLIDLLAELPAGQGSEAEDVLRTLAGDAAPDLSVGNSESSRRAAREAWSAWWKQAGDKLDLAKLAEQPRERGYTLVVALGLGPAKRAAGRVAEYDREGKLRWQIDGLNTPRDAQMLPNGNVFIFELTGRRLTERTTKGEIVWEKTLPGTGLALSAERQANGHVLVTTRTGLVEIDRDGKELKNIPITGPITAAKKLRGGEVVYVTLVGQCVRLDRDGKEAGSFALGRIPVGGLDLLPNGHILAVLQAEDRVAEFDAGGKEVWRAAVLGPTSVARLPDGHVLIACSTRQCVVELDREGKEVWKQAIEGRPLKASRR